MSAFSPEFVAHLSQDCTTVCHCWKLTRRDGTVLGFTDHDRQLVVDGATFLPQSGLSQTEARASLGMAIDTADVEGAMSSDVLDEADILAGQYDGARVETFLVHWMDVAQPAFASRQLARLSVSTGGLSLNSRAWAQASTSRTGACCAGNATRGWAMGAVRWTPRRATIAARAR